MHFLFANQIHRSSSLTLNSVTNEMGVYIYIYINVLHSDGILRQVMVIFKGEGWLA
jgi:hypothetical protein